MEDTPGSIAQLFGSGTGSGPSRGVATGPGAAASWFKTSGVRRDTGVAAAWGGAKQGSCNGCALSGGEGRKAGGGALCAVLS